MKKLKRFLFIIILLTVPFFGFPVIGAIQNFSQIANNLKVADRDTTPGDIVVNTKEGLVRANTPYDKNISGVIGINPVMIFNKVSSSTMPVVSWGETEIKVSNINGEIRKGDFITSSGEKGVGQKATMSGMVVGKALENFNSKEGTIKAYINVQYADIKEGPGGESVFGKVSSELENLGKIPKTLRYILALLLGIGSFLVGYFSFAGNLKEGVRGVSRNPLAKKSIQAAMMLNLIGISILSASGIALALIIIFY